MLGVGTATLNQMLRVSFIDPLTLEQRREGVRELAPRIQAERPARRWESDCVGPHEATGRMLVFTLRDKNERPLQSFE